jgi:16S rRNA processing protein RimM
VTEPDAVLVGRVGRPHGLDGCFFVEDPSQAPERFAVGARLLAGGAPATVMENKRSGGRLVVRLDRRVERGTPLTVERAELPPPDEDAFSVVQLVGLAVEEEGGRVLGRVQDVEPGPANDALVLDSGVLLPLVETCVRAVDLDAGRLVVAAGFADPE